MSRIFGPIMQYSFVVKDMEKAIAHFANTLEIGPFFVLDHVAYKKITYKEHPSDIDMSVAIAYSGDIQIELIQQHNDSPSIFNDFLKTQGEGMQHVGVITHDIKADLTLLETQGINAVQYGEAENGTRFAYLDTALIPGTMVEIFEVSDRLAKGFEFMRNAALKWNPKSDPAKYKP